MWYYVGYLLLSTVLIGIDQFTKYLTVEHIAYGDIISGIPGLFSFTYIKNTGAAWSILEGKMIFFFVVTLIAVAFCLYYLKKYLYENKWLTFGLSFVLAGALGNFIDRFRLGYVVDMIQLDFIHFPIFNVADMTLVIGAICLILFVISDEKKRVNEDRN